jgi:hypothetical protein
MRMDARRAARRRVDPLRKPSRQSRRRISPQPSGKDGWRAHCVVAASLIGISQRRSRRLALHPAIHLSHPHSQCEQDLIATQSLRSDAEGVRVQVRGGKRTLVDGPFSETKEMVGGYFLLDCESKAQAVTIAAECPAAEWATLEVRELGPCFT